MKAERRARVLLALLALALGAAFWLQRDRWDHWRALLVNPSHTRFPIRGIDVSHHQGEIDWQRVKASGRSFAFIKASEGADFRDTRFQENWWRARAVGLATGAYHFFTFCSPGQAQADNFLDAASLGEGTLPLSIDIEFTGNCSSWESVASIQRELRVFVEQVESKSGRRPLLYTTEDVGRELIPPALQAHPYWIRSLWGEPSPEVPWLFWQHSATGEVPGIRGDVDLNVFVGSVREWQRLVSGDRGGAAPSGAP